MVDIVVNNIASLSNKTDAASLEAQPEVFWKDPADYHTACPIDYNNMTSVEQWCVEDSRPVGGMCPLMTVPLSAGWATAS